MELVKWKLLAKAVKQPSEIIRHQTLFTVKLNTIVALKPICLRLYGISVGDKVRIHLAHSTNTPFVVPVKQNVFLDLWLDPYEFEPSKYKLDTLPMPLEIILEWEAQNDGAQLLTVAPERDRLPEWNIEASTVPREVPSEIVNQKD